MNDGTQQLPDSSRDALIRIAELLRGKFTGRLVIEAHEGGVRKVDEHKTWRPSKDAA